MCGNAAPSHSTWMEGTDILLSHGVSAMVAALSCAEQAITPHILIALAIFFDDFPQATDFLHQRRCRSRIKEWAHIWFEIQ